MAIILSETAPVAPPPPDLSLVITQGTETVIKPRSAPGYESRRESQNIVHQVLGRPDPDITLRPATVRVGTLSLVFDDDLSSAVAESAFAAGGEFVLHHGSSVTIDMLFVVTGGIRRRRERAGYWVVELEFQETTP